MARQRAQVTGLKDLCRPRCALNCVAKGRIPARGNLPTASDPASGGRRGRALARRCSPGINTRTDRQADACERSQHGSYIGPEFSRDEILAYLTTNNIPFTG